MTKVSIWVASFIFLLSFAATSTAETSDPKADYEERGCEGRKKTITELRDKVASLESQPWSKGRDDELGNLRASLNEKEKSYKSECEPLEEAIKKLAESIKEEQEREKKRTEETRNTGPTVESRTKMDGSPNSKPSADGSKSDPNATRSAKASKDSSPNRLGNGVAVPKAGADKTPKTKAEEGNATKPATKPAATTPKSAATTKPTPKPNYVTPSKPPKPAVTQGYCICWYWSDEPEPTSCADPRCGPAQSDSLLDLLDILGE